MLDVGDPREFARAFGRWLYGVNPTLPPEQFKAMILEFAESAPIDVGENWSLSIDAFIEEALRGYAGASD